MYQSKLHFLHSSFLVRFHGAGYSVFKSYSRLFSKLWRHVPWHPEDVYEVEMAKKKKKKGIFLRKERVRRRGGDSGRDVIYSPALAAIKFRERKSCVGRWGRTEEGLSQRRVGGGPQYPSSSFSPNTTFPLSNKFHWRLREAAAEAVFLGYNGYRGERAKGEGEGKANFSPIPLFLLPSLRIPRLLMEFLLSLSSLPLLPSHICRCEPPSIAASISARGSRLHRLSGREGGNEMGKLAAAAARRVGVDWIYLGYRTPSPPSPPSPSMTRVGVSQAVASKALQYKVEVQGGIGRSVFVQAWNLLFSPCNIRLACNVILI